MPRHQANPSSSKPELRSPGEHLPFVPSSPKMSPGDEAPAGTPGTGQNVCRCCGGTGKMDNQPCVECDGSGYVITGIGGA